ncbi:MAG TPA: HDOD domain-containing protein [bacterium]|nr:HDOD domain-containing protein [bacterium]
MGRASAQEIERILAKVETVPTLPHLVSKLVQVVTSDASSARDVAKIISLDQAFIARILRLVNSAFYGFPSKIATVTHASAILGFNVIRSLALSITVFDMFRGESYGFDRAAFWKHAIGTGVVARALARKVHYREPEEIFIAGLMHDIGKVIEDKFVHDEFLLVLQTVAEKGCSMREAEDEVLGLDHARVGGKVAEKWNLPVMLREVVRYHHNPPADLNTLTEDGKVVGLVHMANIVSRVKQFGYGGDPNVPEPNQVLWEASGLAENDLRDILENIDQEFTNASAFIEMSAKG